MYENDGFLFFLSQQTFSNIFLYCVVIAVPLMLCVKPCAYAYCCKPHQEHHEADFDRIDGQEPGAGEGNQLMGMQDKDGDVEDIKVYEKILNDETGI